MIKKEITRCIVVLILLTISSAPTPSELLAAEPNGHNSEGSGCGLVVLVNARGVMYQGEKSLIMLNIIIRNNSTIRGNLSRRLALSYLKLWSKNGFLRYDTRNVTLVRTLRKCKRIAPVVEDSYVYWNLSSLNLTLSPQQYAILSFKVIVLESRIKDLNGSINVTASARCLEDGNLTMAQATYVIRCMQACIRCLPHDLLPYIVRVKCLSTNKGELRSLRDSLIVIGNKTYRYQLLVVLVRDPTILFIPQYKHVVIRAFCLYQEDYEIVYFRGRREVRIPCGIFTLTLIVAACAAIVSLRKRRGVSETSALSPLTVPPAPEHVELG